MSTICQRTIRASTYCRLTIKRNKCDYPILLNTILHECGIFLFWLSIDASVVHHNSIPRFVRCSVLREQNKAACRNKTIKIFKYFKDKSLNNRNSK